MENIHKVAELVHAVRQQKRRKVLKYISKLSKGNLQCNWTIIFIQGLQLNNFVRLPRRNISKALFREYVNMCNILSYKHSPSYPIPGPFSHGVPLGGIIIDAGNM